jgi:Prolipoprotein diacylglyceryl transferase
MLTNELFVLLLGVGLSLIVFWACKRLPDERWQFLASVPIIKDSNGRWVGLNFTYYGLLTANALVFGVALLIILMGSLRVPAIVTLSLICAVLIPCLPAARWIARLVEGKQCTLTIAGAFFVGIFIAPVIVALFNSQVASLNLPVIPSLAAIMISYAFGEGLGRLACISFGCCYGVTLDQAPPMLRRIFDRWHFVFSGQLKKIAYASGLEGKQVLPIQAITALLYSVVGLGATLFFLNGYFAAAFILAMTITQAWRVYSETLRADYRGAGRFSAYQCMGLLAVLFALALSYVVPTDQNLAVELSAGVETVWQPLVLLSLQTLWVVVFVFFGKSMVTGAEISFHLHHDRI